jgi:hypothetical protein
MGGDNKLGMTIMLFMIKIHQEHTTSFLGRTNFKWWFMGSQNALMADPDFSKNLSGCLR